tara:strand:+ start:40 stop:534 length:495 start_codon:yes stop_codon:yes gene_type:complete
VIPVESQITLGPLAGGNGVAFRAERAYVRALAFRVYIGNPLGFSRIPENPHNAALVVSPTLHVLAVFARANLPKVLYSVVGSHPIYVVDFTGRLLAVIDGPYEPVDGDIPLIKTAIKVAIRGAQGSYLSTRKPRIVTARDRRAPIVVLRINMPPRQDARAWIIS